MYYYYYVFSRYQSSSDSLRAGWAGLRTGILSGITSVPVQVVKGISDHGAAGAFTGSYQSGNSKVFSELMIKTYITFSLTSIQVEHCSADKGNHLIIFSLRYNPRP